MKRLQPHWCCKIFLLLSLLTINFNLFAQKETSLETLKKYATENLKKWKISPEDVQGLSITHEYTDASTGIHHIYAIQNINGISITGSNLSLHTTALKRVDANNLVPTKLYSVKPLIVSISSSQAVTKLMEEIKSGAIKTFEVKQPAKGTDQVTIYKRNTSPIFDIPARLVYYTDNRLKALLPAWEVQMMDANKDHFWLAYIDASNGKILEKRDLIKHCKFGGYPNDANPGNQIMQQQSNVESETGGLQDPGDPYQQHRNTAIPANKYKVYDLPFESPVDQGAIHALSSRAGDDTASPDGWHRVAGTILYPYTRGNNVWAFYDPSPGPLGGVPSSDPTRTAFANNGPLGTAPATEPFEFNYNIDLNNEPETYRNGAIVNLFYWNNLMHDVFYYMGFTEDAGNFEASHTFTDTTKATAIGQADDVLAQAQDGGGTNNANFLTLPDGTNGQMQMYLWTAAFPDNLVQITSSTSGIPPGGTKYIAVQGSFNTLPVSNTNLYTNPVLNKQFVIVKKNALSTVGSETEGCSTGQMSVALPPSNDVTDKIVLIDRGSCSFVEKVLGAQEGGAAGVIIINNVDGPPLAMGGSDAPANGITIPGVMISKADGDVLKAQIMGGASIIGSLKRDNPPAPKRDGDIDNGVIAHEYGHGISSRLTGGAMSLGPLGGDEQGGEGWSDFVALYMTMRTNDLTAPTAGHPNGVLPNRSIGNYVTYQNYDGRGIREYPYSPDLSVNPATFAYIKRSDYAETHSVGFVWCSMLYELLQSFIDEYGMNDNVYEGANPTVTHNPPATAKGNNIATRLVIEAMKLQPTSPTFIEERDAILKADTLLYNAQHACKIWAAFAKRGLGASAVSGTNSLGDETESYDVPLSCDPTQKRVRIEKSGPVKVNNGAIITYTIKVTNAYSVAVANLKVVDTLDNSLTFVSASDNAVQSGKNVEWTLNLAGNETKTLTVTASLSSTATSTEDFGDDHEGATHEKWTVTSVVPNGQWTLTSNASQAYSGSKYWFAEDVDIPGSNTSLQTTDPISVNTTSELVFIHKYANEDGYDGGVVEVSEDGATWTYLPPSKFVKGGYKGIIPTANNAFIGTDDLAAFTGASDGYVVSIAKLDDYIGKDIYIRFRMVADATGGHTEGGGWWLDDVYVLENRTELENKATAYTGTVGQGKVYDREGSNARSSTSGFVLAGSVLPNNLGTLTAAVNRQAVDLSWLTFTESYSVNFEIQRKTPGQPDFVTIGSIQAAGNSTAKRNYSFHDETVYGNNKYQYRIKQVNKTGTFYYTNIASVQLGGKIFKAFVYPNPVENTANLSIINPAGDKVMINIFDISGKKLFSLNGGNVQSQLITIPVQQFKSGTYWVEVNAGSEHTTLKLVKK